MLTLLRRVEIKVWAHSSAGRASALQAEGHRFEPYCAHQSFFQHIKASKCGRIAQLGEHLPYKQRVIGSSPIVPTTFFIKESCKMMLDLSPIINNEGKRLDLDFQLDLTSADTDICFKSPVGITGTVLNIGGSLELAAKAEAVIEYACDRCLDSFERPFECSFEEVLKKEDLAHEDENPDAIYFQGSSVELDEIVLNNIILSLPLKNLCSEDCKGLCPQCGQNLNYGECKCDTRPTDPRFDVLDKFFE